MALFGSINIQMGNNQGFNPLQSMGQGPAGFPGQGGIEQQMMMQMMQLMMGMMMTMMGGMLQQNQGGFGAPGQFNPLQNPAFGGLGGSPGSNGLNSFLGGGGGPGVMGGTSGGFGAQPSGPNTMTPPSSSGPLSQLSQNPQERIKQVVDAAKRTYPDQPHMAKLAAAQALLESGLHGNKPSTLASQHNNLFGIKGSGTAGSVNMRTGEHLNGQNVTVNAGFAKNATLEDSFAQHKKLMGNSRYAGVRSAGSFEQAAGAVRSAGYATDPNYTQKLISIYNSHLKQYF